MYNPQVVRIWPSRAEEEEALRLEAEEAELAPEPEETSDGNVPAIDGSAFNATTGSYSGLYGQGPVDADMQATLDAIMNISSHQNTVDSLLSGNHPDVSGQNIHSSANDDVIIPPDQDEILKEANEIYERLLREAAEDEAKKQAEIEEMRRQAELQFAQ